MCSAVITEDCNVCRRAITSAGGVALDGASGSGNRLNPSVLASLSPGRYEMVYWYAPRRRAQRCSLADAMVGTARCSLSKYCRGLWSDRSQTAFRIHSGENA